MSSEEILEKIQSMFRDIFDDADLTVTVETMAADIEDWDSFAQMQIVMGVEAMFGIKFSTDEVTEFKNVGDMLECIAGHLG